MGVLNTQRAVRNLSMWLGHQNFGEQLVLLLPLSLLLSTFSLSLAFSFEDVERGSYCKTFSHINYGHPSRYLGKGWQILAAKYWPQCHKFDLVNSLSKKSLH